MNLNQIKSDCKCVAEDLYLSVLYFLEKYPHQKEIYVKELKQACINLIEDVNRGIEK